METRQRPRLSGFIRSYGNVSFQVHAGLIFWLNGRWGKQKKINGVKKDKWGERKKSAEKRGL